MYFGNIVSDKGLCIEGFKSFSKNESIDNDLPTLFVGWDLVKEKFGKTVSILHKKIDTKIYWTFSSKERKVDFECDIEKFKELCFNNFGENIPYVYLDILYGKPKINKKIIKKILSLTESFIFIAENNMVYIFGENIIFGIDLNILEYFDNKKEKILYKINELKNSVLIDSNIFNKYRDFLYKIKNKNRLIPYIVKNGKNE
jgi:hypothetical protein